MNICVSTEPQIWVRESYSIMGKGIKYSLRTASFGLQPGIFTEVRYSPVSIISLPILKMDLRQSLNLKFFTVSLHSVLLHYRVIGIYSPGENVFDSIMNSVRDMDVPIPKYPPTLFSWA